MGFTLTGVVLAVSFGSMPNSVQPVDLMREPLAIRVRTYGRDAVPAATFRAATDLANGILSGVGLLAEWTDCDLPDSHAVCGAVPEHGEFLVRIMKHRPDNASHGCGVSLRPQGGHAGHLITVYADCVRKGSDELHVAEPVILAYTIVHEIGHLLLPEGHSFSGIMRARPDRMDWQRAARGALNVY